MRLALKIFAILAVMHICSRAFAQNEPGFGWLEGVLVTDRGEPAASRCFAPNNCKNASLALRSESGEEVTAENDLSRGGFYTFRNLRPGVYELFVEQTEQFVQREKISYRPVHIFGVVVAPDKRMRLNITVHEGRGLEEIGQPTVATEEVISISDELARLQKEIDALKVKLGVK